MYLSSNQSRILAMESLKTSIALIESFGVALPDDIKDENVVMSTHKELRRICKNATCPDGFIVVFYCPTCKIFSRKHSVFCPQCKKCKFILNCASKKCMSQCEKYVEGRNPICSHSTKVINREVPHMLYAPVWTSLTDCFLHLRDDLVDYLRQDICGSIRHDYENDAITALSSLNSLSAFIQMKEDEIVTEIIAANSNLESPETQRSFLNPDYKNSLDRKLKEQCII